MMELGYSCICLVHEIYEYIKLFNVHVQRISLEFYSSTICRHYSPSLPSSYPKVFLLVIVIQMYLQPWMQEIIKKAKL